MEIRGGFKLTGFFDDEPCALEFPIVHFFDCLLSTGMGIISNKCVVSFHLDFGYFPELFEEFTQIFAGTFAVDPGNVYV